MILTEQQVQKYREIYQNVFGKEISQEKALAEGTKLVLLAKLLLADSKHRQKPSEFPEISGQQNYK